MVRHMDSGLLYRHQISHLYIAHALLLYHCFLCKYIALVIFVFHNVFFWIFPCTSGPSLDSHWSNILKLGIQSYWSSLNGTELSSIECLVLENGGFFSNCDGLWSLVHINEFNTNGIVASCISFTFISNISFVLEHLVDSRTSCSMFMNCENWNFSKFPLCFVRW